MQTITITLDGVEVSGFPGMTILELARESGVEIPTLCHDTRLSPHGACRLCLVEDEPTKALLASCATPIRSGLVINTKSPRVMERRKTIIQLMLASHPDSCMVCDKGNRCQLREIASDMGIGRVRFQKLPQRHIIEEVNPFIQRDLSKCILCAKCIRVDQELVVEGAIDYTGRGFVARPATLDDKPLEKSECTFCGACVAVCPVGALTESDKPYGGTTSKAVETTCGFCGCGCGVRLEVKGNQIIRARPAEGPGNHGALCIRGSYGYDYVHSPERLTRPLLKTEKGFREVSWDEALARAAAEFQRINTAHGADSLAVLGSSKCTNEENYLLQRLARGVVGTNNIDNGSSFFSQASLFGMGQTTGFPGSTNSLADIERSDAILVIGADPTTCAPAVGYAIKRAAKFKSARLLIIDPRETKLTAFARVWLRPRFGTDVALLNAMAKLIIDEGLYDQEFVERRTDNFADLSGQLKPFTLAYASEATGVPAESIELAALMIGKAERLSIIFGNGICCGSRGLDCVTALANLGMLNGIIGQRGAGLYALKQDNNAQGACDMGALPDFLPGYRSVEDNNVRKSFEELWGVELSALPGLNAVQMVEQAGDGRLKGMLIVGENPVASLPSPAVTRRGLSSLEFLVVVDMFLTETAALANLVLPAASFAEKEGTFTNFEGRIRPVRRAVAGPGDSLPDFDIILRLARRMGHEMPYISPQEVMEEIREMVPAYQATAGLTGEADDADLGPASGFSGTGRLHGGLFPSGFVRFSPVQYAAPTEVPDEGYPLTLLIGTTLGRFGSGARTARSARLKRSFPQSWVEIGESDAERFGLRAGDKVKVISSVSEISSVVVMTQTLPTGTIFMPMSFPESPVNELLRVIVDPNTRMAEVENCHVRLERMDDSV